METFKAEVERRAGIKFEPIRPYEFTGRGDRIGWVKGIDNNWHLTLFIENGRILDYPGRPLKKLACWRSRRFTKVNSVSPPTRT